VEKTLVMVKPDGVRRALIGEVISRIEGKNLQIRDIKMLQIDRDLANRHYEEHKEKPFFEELVSFITSGPVVALVVEGEDAVSVVRELMGATNPKDAAPGTIRGDFGKEITENIVHGSDSTTSAERELGLFFPEPWWDLR
jgi:nucleoside-diphosphate kinase